MTKLTLTMISLVAICLSLPATAQDDGGSALTAGMGYSSLHGTIANVGLEATDIQGSGIDASLDLRKGDGGQGAKVRLRYGVALGDTFFGPATVADYRLTYGLSDWDDQSFSSESARISAGLAAPGAGFDYRAQVFWQTNNTYDARAAASPLVLNDLGRSATGGVVLGLGRSTLDSADLLAGGYSLDGSVTAAMFGDRRFTAIDVKASAAMPFGDANAVLLRGEAGMIKGQDGQNVSIHDRAFMGGGTPRGFALGGAGPRDFTDDIDSPLGGNRYVFGSVEARRRVSDRVTIGLFADTGASWDLDTTIGGAMGVIDDGLHLRTSVGASVYWTTGMGTLRVSFAEAVDQQDYDQLNPVSIELVSKF